MVPVTIFPFRLGAKSVTPGGTGEGFDSPVLDTGTTSEFAF